MKLSKIAALFMVPVLALCLVPCGMFGARWQCERICELRS